ncbi:hypothetical protein KR074_009142 [Drosophila pseudoananassae]|nr:hypothetical protein KR074_009142 [Drosophila pseudoananassae]
MPLDQVFIGLARNRNWINVVLMRSVNLYQPNTINANLTEMIEVCSNGFSWKESNLEYRVELDKFFEIATNGDEGEHLFGMGEMEDNNVIFGVALRRLTHRIIAPEIDLADLRICIKESKRYSLHCSNCANEVITAREFAQVKPVPVTTMKPQNYFCGRGKIPIFPIVDHIYYGLNYLVVNPKVVGPGVTYTRGQRRLLCSRCRQLLGEALGLNVAVQLYADALRVLPWVEDNSAVQFQEVFGHVTVTQLMLRLMHDGEPICSEKTRIFLTAIRPDGQLHYLQLQVYTRKIPLLRSSLASKNRSQPRHGVAAETESSSESEFDAISSDSSDTTFTPAEEILSPALFKRPKRERPVKVVKYVEVNGYRAYRVKYVFSGSDHELSNNHEVIQQWREEGSRMLRVSYTMMAEIMTELNANEHMVAALEKAPTPVQTDQPRVSFIIYETDEEFYERRNKR